jgi:stage II sporulation protein D
VTRTHRTGNAGAAVAAAVAVGMAVAVACRTLPSRPAGPSPQVFDVDAFVPSPRVSVGLSTDAARVAIAADAGVVAWVPAEGKARRPVEAPTLDFARSPSGSLGVRLVQTGDEIGSAYIVPKADGEILRVDGVPYRGVIEVRRGDEGLTIIDVVNVEDYLRGVVPNELSPQAFPQIEALKAQAVAARTYALRNLGQFQARGYDICATPACQVYKGKSTESPLSDRAVEETRGIAATYQGTPIEALYTSTCGGHTEDGENIFEGESAPYLHGVVCSPEKSAWSLVRTTAPAHIQGDDEDSGRDLALLVSLGVLEARSYPPALLKGAASDAELKAWTGRLVAAAKHKAEDVAVEGPLARRAAFFRYLVAAIGWDERAKRLLAPGDPDYLLQVEDRAELASPDEALAAALLIQEGILSPLPDNTLRGARPITRAQALSLLARTAEKAGAPALASGEFQGSEAGQLKVTVAGTLLSFALEPQVRLFRSLDGSRAAASELSLAAGDPVSFVAQEGRVSFLEVDQSRMGASADRTSRYFRWEVRLSPAEVAKAIVRYGNVGAVRDVIPRRIGSSGRVVDLTVVGSDSDLELKGLKIRWALGLRENLFVIDRQLSASGEVERFVFTGKGWGHGVGLCQVGAFGMARSGAAYAGILTHYYPGATVEKVY